MDQERLEQEWEKIRWQLGQIIKSWSKVSRTVNPDYVVYCVEQDGLEIPFCYLYDNILQLTYLTDDMYKTILAQFDSVEPTLDLNGPGKYVALSLDQYRFTELIPQIEPVYRSIILKDNPHFELDH